MTPNLSPVHFIAATDSSSDSLKAQRKVACYDWDRVKGQRSAVQSSQYNTKWRMYSIHGNGLDIQCMHVSSNYCLILYCNL